ncbi:MAG: EAL domain-containing protein [Chromatiaceae bacterium]|nr:EAL domain-containing protein [Chromatiaceae bacterium]
MKVWSFQRIKRASVIALLVFLLAESLLAWTLWMVFRNETTHLLTLYRSELERSYEDIVNDYARLITLLNLQSVDVPAVRKLLAQAASASVEERRALRGSLYRALAPTYDLLRSQDLRVLQFVEPDGRSFLRFNRPDLYDDRIASQRPTLAEVIANQQAAQGFENGRVYPGYRYAYPLFQDDQFIGVVDYSLSFDALRRAAQRLGDTASGSDQTGRQSANRLLLRRDLMQKIAHPSALALFETTPLHPDYLVEDDTSSLRDATLVEPKPPWVAALDLNLASDQGIHLAMERGDPFARNTCIGLSRCWAVLVLPVRDSQGQIAASFVSYLETPEYVVQRDWFIGLFLIVTLVLGFLVLTLRRWISSRQSLRTIGDHMAEGLYVMDRDGRILYSNQAASELLGYSQDQLSRQSAHQLFHLHGEPDDVPASECPVQQAPLRGEVYRSDTEVFRHRDGQRLPVSVVASPLYVEGELSGSVVLFRDLRAEKAAKEKLQTADVAFRHLAEAVCVTDQRASIQAVNAALTRITGYREDEVLGKNPSIFASGRQDKAFYERLWHELLTRGHWEGELWNRRKNGEEFPEWLKINAVRDPSGEIVGFVGVFNDISELRAKEARLHELAYFDQVTGLYNRNAFLEALEEELSQAQASASQFALLLCDIDRFKRINDSLGHAAGDQALKKIAGRIQQVLGPTDCAARCGGDEFGLMMRCLEHPAAPSHTAHALLAALRHPIKIAGKRVDVSASIGIALFPKDGQDSATLIKCANAALLQAKAQGRNGYRYFTAALDDDANSRFELESALRNALRKRQFRVHYQPKVSLVDGRVVGLEALVRWQHPSEGLLNPGRFLAVAQETGLMQPITEWVLQEACRQCKQWQAEGLSVGRISINLDVGFFQPSLLEKLLLQTVRESGIDPQDLEFEILEAAMRDEPEIAEFWRHLVGAGFELSIDDFGTGESSLSRLKHLPFSTLKIDRKFVLDIVEQERDWAMVRTIIGMAKSMGKETVAEGVETELQVRYLINAGCDIVQGYYFCKPCPAAEIVTFVKAGSSIERVQKLRKQLRPTNQVVRYLEPAQRKAAEPRLS